MQPLQAVLAGCYEARRAAGLSGVPISTLYDWARKEVVVPSVSPTREMLWSYADLMALRVVYWLRHQKVAPSETIPASPMSQVREVLSELEARGEDIWAESSQPKPTSIRVDRSGRIYLSDGWTAGSGGRYALTLGVLAPFEVGTVRGPDLVQPRPTLRIVPGKVSGEPHLMESRITTRTIAALHKRYRDVDRILAFYPNVSSDAIKQAIELEDALAA